VIEMKITASSNGLRKSLFIALMTAS